MDRTKSFFPLLVSAFIVLVGVFFLFLTLVETPLLTPEPPGRYYLMGIAAVFAAVGVYYAFLAVRGGLKRQGKSLKEIRREAVESMKDPLLLKKIVVDEEESPEIRELAKKRLEELVGKDG